MYSVQLICFLFPSLESARRQSQTKWCLTFISTVPHPHHCIMQGAVERRQKMYFCQSAARSAPSSRDSPGTGPADSVRKTLRQSQTYPPAHWRSLHSSPRGAVFAAAAEGSETSAKGCVAWWQSVGVMLVFVDNSYSLLLPGAPIATSVSSCVNDRIGLPFVCR